MGSATSSSRGGEGSPERGLRALLRAALPTERFGDHTTLLSGTGQNLAGLVVFVLASFATNVLISRGFGREGASVLGVVTLATQFAFVAGAATRFGMDMAAVRRVAIDVGRGEPGRARGVVARAAGIAAVVSVVAGAAIAVAAGPLTGAVSAGRVPASALRAAALAIPFVALSQVYLGGTRGLKVMRHTLYVYWAGQPTAWIVLMLMSWLVAKTAGATVLAYALSWILATAAAWWAWRRETAGFPPIEADRHEVRSLLRYGAPRAPAALLAQLLFWTDYFVAARFVSAAELGIYAAAVRVAHSLVLFLIAVNYMFSPFVADLHARGERERLDRLYKALTRWMVAGTLPLVLLFLVVPGPALRVFGADFDAGSTALRILLVGQLVNVGVGSVGFILIMVGRTGWDLVVYAATFVLDLGVAFLLAPRLGIEGAAVAQTITMVASNGARLWLVWRFVGIQPFSLHYARLAVPAAGGGIVMVAVAAAVAGTSWPAQVAAVAGAGFVVYVGLVVRTALTPTERSALRRLRGNP